MTEWKVVKLSDLGEIVGGATPSTSKEDYYNGTIPWLTPKDLAGYLGRYISRGERNITQAGLDSCSAKIMPKNTVLFSSRAPIGYLAIAENDICTNQGFKSIIPNDDTNYLFLYYLLKYNKNIIESLGSGTTFKEVSGATMRHVEVRVPVSIEIQEKIASILDSIDAKIENNRCIINNLLQQVQAIYKNYFELCTDNIMPMSTLIDVRDGTHSSPKPKETGMSLITSKHLLPFGVDKSSANLISEEDYKKANERSAVATYDILLSMIGTVGLVSFIIENPVDFAIKNVGLFRTSCNPELAYYIHCYLRSDPTQQLIEQFLAGSTQKYISLTELRNMPIHRPTIERLDSFNDSVKPIYQMIIANTQENKSLIQLRDTLLPRLMSGELDVSDIKF